MNYDEKRKQYLAEKFGIKNGKLEYNEPPKEKEITVADLEHLNAQNERAGCKLKVATASTGFKVNGKAMTRLYYDYKP